jgi:predicted acetyltransferase
VIDLSLRPLSVADEDVALLACRELAADGFSFLVEDYDPSEAWIAYLARLDRVSRGVSLPEGRVPATFLVAVVDDTIVGRTSIRHALNDFLTTWGGHIGYGVRPAFRRRGYATAILKQSLNVARTLGIEQALVTCYDSNVASAAVIESCGGVLENIVPGLAGEAPKRRYWLAT